MNKVQRDKNRRTAANLSLAVRDTHKCVRCGKETKVGHYMPPSFGLKGFWACPNLYDENGVRK